MIDFSLHLEAMAWLRYGKQFAYVASEAGFFNADVLGSDGKKLIEVEVKKTKSDFANDFRNKPWKHMFYGKPVESQLAWVPNQFYFLVPAKLEVEALKILLDNDSPAGLLVLDRPMTGIYGYAHRKHVGVVKRSKAIHDRPPSATVLAKLAKRMSSDLVTTKLCLENLGRQGQIGPEALTELAQVLHTLPQTPDWESADEAHPHQVPTQPRHGQGQNNPPRGGDLSGSDRTGEEEKQIQPPPNCS